MILKPNPTALPMNFTDLLMVNQLPALSELETTSIDGKPFLNPFQRVLALSQDDYQKSVLNPKDIAKNEKRRIESHIPRGIPVEEDDEFPQKKVKIQNSKDRINHHIGQPKFSVEPSAKFVGPLTKNLTHDSVEAFSHTNEGYMEFKNPKTKIKKKLNQRIVAMCKHRSQDKIFFKVESDSDKNEGKTLNILTRDELLKENPLLLLSFYEKNLQFSKSKDFMPAKLKKFSCKF